LVTRVGSYMAGRNRLGGLAAKPIIDHYEAELDNEHLYSEEFLYVAIREREAQIPTDGQKNHLRFKLPPLE
jgi:hypothetical protein